LIAEPTFLVEFTRSELDALTKLLPQAVQGLPVATPFRKIVTVILAKVADAQNPSKKAT
jgi:hypothetical protein